MKILVQYIPDQVKCRFVKYNNGQRMWITDNSWYPSVGWCPHLNIGDGECIDCSLVVEV